MNSLVVLFAVLGAVAAKPQLYGFGGSDYHRSSQYIAQPDAVSTQYREQVSGPEVIGAQAWGQPLAYSLPNYGGLHYLKKRSLYEPISYALPSAVSHQSRVDVHHSPILTQAVVAEPILAKTVVAEPVVYTAPSAVSHQSRVDIHSSPVIAPVIAEPAIVAEPILTKTVVAEPVVYAAPSAVSHQSRVDIHSKPAIFAGHAPVYSTYNALPLAYSYPQYPHALW